MVFWNNDIQGGECSLKEFQTHQGMERHSLKHMNSCTSARHWQLIITVGVYLDIAEFLIVVKLSSILKDFLSFDFLTLLPLNSWGGLA